MVLGMGMRTIWISLRAMNYTDQAFRASIRNVENLEKSEKQHLQTLLKQKDVARLTIQTGVLYAATIAMVGMQLASLLNMTQVGAEYMSEFNQTVDELKVAFADTLFEALKPLLDVLKVFMGFIRDSGPLRNVIVYVGLLAGGLFTLYAVYLILRGAIAQYNANLALNNFFTEMSVKHGVSMVASNTAVGFSFKSVAVAIGLVTAGLTIFTLLGSVIGNQAGAIVAAVASITAALLALAVAMNIVSVGTLTPLQLGAFAAGAGIAAGVMGIQANQGFANGTRGLPNTGLFLGHKGEIVYNPATNRPAGMESEVMGRREPSTTVQDIDINIAQLNTKADYDDTKEKLGRELYNIAKRSR